MQVERPFERARGATLGVGRGVPDVAAGITDFEANLLPENKRSAPARRLFPVRCHSLDICRFYGQKSS